MEFFHVSSSPSPYSHANQRFTSEKHNSADTKTDHFILDDLLDYPTDDLLDFVADSSTAVDSCNSSSHCGAAEPYLAGDDGCRSSVDKYQFSNLCIPYDDLAEFEWLSNFFEESFSNEDVKKLQLLSGVKARPKHEPETHRNKPMSTINRTNNLIFNYDMTIPSKSRTKRLRATSHNWAARVPVMYTEPVLNTSSNSKHVNIVSNSRNEEGRKCVHCATSKTPQWRTGPMGPRTLCNACGVRYKSGRLVPEYRPAASPTFVLTKHSNSHRKVIELQRQKMQKTMHHQQQFVNHQDAMLQMPNAENYLSSMKF